MKGGGLRPCVKRWLCANRLGIRVSNCVETGSIQLPSCVRRANTGINKQSSLGLEPDRLTGGVELIKCAFQTHYKDPLNIHIQLVRLASSTILWYCPPLQYYRRQIILIDSGTFCWFFFLLVCLFLAVHSLVVFILVANSRYVHLIRKSSHQGQGWHV